MSQESNEDPNQERKLSQGPLTEPMDQMEQGLEQADGEAAAAEPSEGLRLRLDPEEFEAPEAKKEDESPSRRRKLGALLLYAWFFWLCFGLFAYLTFPYHKLRDFIVDRVQYEQVGQFTRPTGQQLSIVELEPSWFTGVRASGIQYSRPPRAPMDPPLELAIPEATARLKLLPLALGTGRLDFSAELPMGKLHGSVAVGLFSQSLERFEIHFERVNLRALGGLRFLTTIPVRGILNGKVELDLTSGLEKTDGIFDLVIRNLEIGDDETQLRIPGLPGGLTVPPAHIGDLELRLPVEDGIGFIEKLESEGEHLHVEGAGNFRLQAPFDASRFDILVKATFQDAYAESSPRAKTIMDLLSRNAVATQARTTDGAHQIRVRGSVRTSLRATPAARDRIEDLKQRPSE